MGSLILKPKLTFYMTISQLSICRNYSSDYVVIAIMYLVMYISYRVNKKL